MLGVETTFKMNPEELRNNLDNLNETQNTKNLET